ncbi:MAG: hypothetical protein AMJ53_12865 [Gammaproteobacteria bacterium SG8_11]|nr:MAG: hypothetical protein AMJ53_12865 [Gammaproteobacteria bacterium SG8_11]
MKNKRLYLFTLFYIVVLAIVFHWIYPEVSLTAVTTVIALCGFILAIGTNVLMNCVKKQQGKDDEK